jgi:TonB family protein
MNGRKQRLLWNGVSINGGRIAGRIHRALSSQPRAPRLTRLTAAFIWTTAAILVWCAGALQFQSVARGQQYPPDFPQSMRMTTEQVAELEQQHAANPDDEKTTQKLLMYYSITQNRQEIAQLIFSLIDHHPESHLLHRTVLWIDRANYEEAKKRWLVQVARNPNDAQVLGNAAGSLGFDDGAIDYLQRAQALDPANWTEDLAMQYSWALLGNDGRLPSAGTVQLAGQVRASLESSTDTGLILATVQAMLSSANQSVLGASGPPPDLQLVKSLSFEFLNRAEQLQPGSQAVVELREGVRLLGASLKPREAVTSAPPVLRVGGAVQAVNLLASTPPVYPPGAQARGIQGIVKLQIRINDTGHVDSAVISGDPALTGSAIAAVQQYVYKPTNLNGKPCAVVTTVEVPFHLNQ